MRHRALTSLMPIFALAASCSFVDVGHKVYERQELRLAAPRAALVEVVKSYGRKNRWSLVATRTADSVVLEALSSPVRDSGTVMRSRWFFTIDDGEILVEKRLEVLFDATGEVWDASLVVSDGYGYESERQVMAELAELAARLPGGIDGRVVVTVSRR